MYNQIIKFSSILLVLMVFSACNSKKSEKWFLAKAPSFQELIEKNDLIVFSEEALEKRLENLVDAKKNLNKVDYEVLSESSKVTYANIQKGINRELYLQDTLDVFHWNAAIYRFTPLIQKELASGKPEDKFKAASEILELADSFYSTAKTNISKAISIKKGKLAVEEHRMDYLFLQNEFPKILEEASISDDLKREVGEKIPNLQFQIKDYIGYVMSLVNNLDDLDNSVLIVEEGDDLSKYSE